MIERVNMDEEHAAQQQLAVARLLDSAWDPIGVYQDEDGPPAGEYKSYAWRVLSHLQHGDSVVEIAGLLKEIKADMMGLEPGPEDSQAAEALVDWYRSASRA